MDAKQLFKDLGYKQTIEEIEEDTIGYIKSIKEKDGHVKMESIYFFNISIPEKIEFFYFMDLRGMITIPIPLTLKHIYAINIQLKELNYNWEE